MKCKDQREYAGRFTHLVLIVTLYKGKEGESSMLHGPSTQHLGPGAEVIVTVHAWKGSPETRRGHHGLMTKGPLTRMIAALDHLFQTSDCFLAFSCNALLRRRRFACLARFAFAPRWWRLSSQSWVRQRGGPEVEHIKKETSQNHVVSGRNSTLAPQIKRRSRKPSISEWLNRRTIKQDMQACF